MYFKYKVPKNQRFMYRNKKTIYCEVARTIEGDDMKIYLVKMLNCCNAYNIFFDKRLQKPNLLDRIRIFFIKKW